MPQENHHEYLKFANILADASGEVLRQCFKSAFNMEQKDDLSPVTEADIEVESRIRLLIEGQFPDHGIIGEELGNTNPDSPYQWIIDPIDGTKSFIAGYPIFTTLIALLHNKKPIIGIINQPILYQRWAAISGSATLYNNNPLPALNNTREIANTRIATTSTGYFTDKQAEKFAALKNASATTILGGDGYAYAMLANGRLDIVVDAGMKVYDFCALSPIIEGVGGIITDWQGEAINLLSGGNIIASNNKNLHDKCLNLLM